MPKDLFEHALSKVVFAGAFILIRAFSRQCPVSMLVLAARCKLVAYPGIPW